jgi:hypothetical protein
MGKRSNAHQLTTFIQITDAWGVGFDVTAQVVDCFPFMVLEFCCTSFQFENASHCDFGSV